MDQPGNKVSGLKPGAYREAVVRQRIPLNRGSWPYRGSDPDQLAPVDRYSNGCHKQHNTRWSHYRSAVHNGSSLGFVGTCSSIVAVEKSPQGPQQRAFAFPAAASRRCMLQNTVRHS